jgi:hypothetical protein
VVRGSGRKGEGSSGSRVRGGGGVDVKGRERERKRVPSTIDLMIDFFLLMWMAWACLLATRFHIWKFNQMRTPIPEQSCVPIHKYKT